MSHIYHVMYVQLIRLIPKRLDREKPLVWPLVIGEYNSIVMAISIFRLQQRYVLYSAAVQLYGRL